MTIQPDPLEKTIVNIDLSKGADERSRPELTSSATSIINLVQDQVGSWVKRPGTTQGPASDASGTSGQPALPKKIMQLVQGWGVVADGGRLYHRMDTQGTFRSKGYLMDLSVTSANVSGSTNASAIIATYGPRIQAVASCTTHDAYTVTYTTGAAWHLGIVERATGNEVRYSSADFVTSVQSPVMKMVFVGDRYLHICAPATFGSTTINLVVIDVQSALPATGAGVSAGVTVASGAGTVLLDMVGGTSRSWVLYRQTAQDLVGVFTGSTGAFIDTHTPSSGVGYGAIGVDEVAGNVWLMVQGGSAKFKAFSTTSTSTQTVAPFTSSHSSNYFACNTTNGSLRTVHQSTATFGGTTIASISICNLAAGASDTTLVGTILGWSYLSVPFCVSNSGKVFIQLKKSVSDGDLAPHVLADISSFTPYVSGAAFGTVRLACNLEPFVALKDFTSYYSEPYRYSSYDGYEATVCVPVQTAARTAGIAFLRVRHNDTTAMGNAGFSGSSHVAHGGVNAYDGSRVTEQGFADYPIMTNQVITTATGDVGTGLRKYVVVFRSVDSNGASSYSRTYGPVSATNTSGVTDQNLLTVQAHSVTNREAGDRVSSPVIDIYRTQAGGTQYYLCGTSQEDIASSSVTTLQQASLDTATGLFTMYDLLSDDTLATHAIMYRQPGTTNAPADRYAAPACKFIIQHKDRLFCTDSYGQRVYYSSFFVDGESAWFNPAFNFYVHAGSGPITGLASADGRLIVFKKDAIFVVDGDGPGEAGPSGNEYSQPSALSCRYGCVDHRSIVQTPDGIMFRSSRGLELLDRKLGVSWVGEAVLNTVDENPVTTGACMDSVGRVHWTLAESETAAGSGGVDGVEVVYDLTNKAWSTHYATNSAGTYARCKQGCASVLDGSTERVAYCDDVAGVYLSSSSVGTDGSAYVPFTIETGWIKQGPQARQRVSDILFLAKKRTGANHALKISIAYDYVDSYVDTCTWEPGVLNALDIEEVAVRPSIQQVLSFKIKIQDQAPGDLTNYPIGTGVGCDVLALGAEVAQKNGPPRLRSSAVMGLVPAPIVSPGFTAQLGTSASYLANIENGINQ